MHPHGLSLIAAAAPVVLFCATLTAGPGFSAQAKSGGSFGWVGDATNPNADGQLKWATGAYTTEGSS
jgi:hypothetical protein